MQLILERSRQSLRLTGSFNELENIPNFYNNVTNVKTTYPGIIIQVKDANGIIKVY